VKTEQICFSSSECNTFLSFTKKSENNKKDSQNHSAVQFCRLKCYVTFIHSSRWQQNHINHIAQLFYHCRLQKKIVNILILQES